MNMFMKWRIALLRWKARNAFLTFLAEAEQSDCGFATLKVVSSRAAMAAKNSNSAMRKLKEIDPEFPHEWEPL